MLNIAIATDIPAEAGRFAPIVSKNCEAAVGSGRCPLAQELGASSVVAWYAIVRADDAAGTRLRIEFHDKSAAGALVETRELAFSERDGADARCASAGAVIAAFVAARDDGTQAAPRAAETSAPPAPEPVPWGFDLAAVAGPALDRGAYRVGALGRGFVGLPTAPNVFVALSLRYAERPGDVDLGWASIAAGIGARTGGKNAPATAELLGELVVERLFVTGRNAATGHEASSEENRFGGRLGVSGTLAISRGLAFLVGADVSVMRPAVDITLVDAKVGRTPGVEFSFSAGLRYRR